MLTQSDMNEGSIAQIIWFQKSFMRNVWGHVEFSTNRHCWICRWMCEINLRKACVWSIFAQKSFTIMLLETFMTCFFYWT